MNVNQARTQVATYLRDAGAFQAVAATEAVGERASDEVENSAQRIADEYDGLFRQLDIDLDAVNSAQLQMERGLTDETIERERRGLAPLPSGDLRTFSEEEFRYLHDLGRVTRLSIFDEAYATAVPAEIDQLIEADISPATPIRSVDGHPTEWITFEGPTRGHGPDGMGSTVLQKSDCLKNLYDGMVRFAQSYNNVVPDNQRDLLVAPESIELNINRVSGDDNARWSGLHAHQDDARFDNALRALPEGSVQHTAIRSRVLTISVYFRHEKDRDDRQAATGGALVFYAVRADRGPNDRAIFDVVLADHNTGAVFLPTTVHAVARMPAPPSVRYSSQAFFPSKNAWETKIRPRIDNG